MPTSPRVVTVQCEDFSGRRLLPPCSVGSVECHHHSDNNSKDTIPIPFFVLFLYIPFIAHRCSYRDFNGKVKHCEGPYDFHSEADLPQLETKLMGIRPACGKQSLP